MIESLLTFPKDYEIVKKKKRGGRKEKTLPIQRFHTLQRNFQY